MHMSKRRGGHSFIRTEKYKAPKSNMDISTELEDWGGIKKEFKRIEIKTRM